MWGTNFKTDIFLKRISFSYDSEVDDKIEEISEDIQKLKEKINMYVSANVKDLIPLDWQEEPITFIQMKISEIWEELEAQYSLLYKLNLYKEYLIANKIELNIN